MIPTHYKMRVPRTLAYPIGAELVSSALAEVPQRERMTLGFYDKPTIFASDYHQLLARGIYAVVAASYRNLGPGLSGSNRDIETGFYTESWELSIYPVPVKEKARVRAALVADGLPAVRGWLTLARPATWREGRHGFQVLYHERSGGVTFHDS